MAMNQKQTWTLKAWLLIVCILGLFPPLTTKRRDWIGLYNGVPFHTVGTQTRHGFVLHSDWGPWLDYGNQDTVIAIPSNTVQETVTTINLPALLCELLALTAAAGFVFSAHKTIEEPDVPG